MTLDEFFNNLNENDFDHLPHEKRIKIKALHRVWKTRYNKDTVKDSKIREILHLAGYKRKQSEVWVKDNKEILL